MTTLVADIGGSNVKLWKDDETDRLKFESGRLFTPQQFVERIQTVAKEWRFDRLSIGYPGSVSNGRPSADPYNLGMGWVGFDWSTAFDCPLRIMNDACMQALGSYDGGRMLFLGLGTSLGTALIADEMIVPLALGHLQFGPAQTFESSLNRKGLKELGLKRWSRSVVKAAIILKNAFLTDYVVLGGGNAKQLQELPAGIRKGGNHHAYIGGLRMWEPAHAFAATRATTTDAAKICSEGLGRVRSESADSIAGI